MFCNDYESGRDGSMKICRLGAGGAAFRRCTALGRKPNSMITAVFPASARAVAAAQHPFGFVSRAAARAKTTGAMNERDSRTRQHRKQASHCGAYLMGAPMVMCPWLFDAASTACRCGCAGGPTAGIAERRDAVAIFRGGTGRGNVLVPLLSVVTVPLVRPPASRNVV